MKRISAATIVVSLLWGANASANGSVSAPELPQGFDVLQASPEQIKQYKLPPKPVDPAALESWKSMMWHLFHGNRVTNFIGPLPHIKHRPYIGSIQNLDAVPANWSGCVDLIKAPRPGPELEATLVVPKFSAHDANLDAVSYWTGFDGVVDNNVLQAGLDCLIDGSTGDNECFTWVAYFPDATIGLFPVNPGDVIGLFAFHNTDGTGGGFYVFNYSNGDVAGGSITCTVPACPSPDPYTGTSAEWIVEAPEVNGQIAPMVNIERGVEIYNCIMLSFNGARDRYPYDAPNTTSYKITLVQNGVVAAAPQKINAFSFDVVTYP
jgi:hypothetical protein